MSKTNPEAEKFMEEFNDVVKRLDELKNDLTWRIPDVEGEEATLEQLKAKQKHDPMADVATQAIIVRVLKGVLEDKLNEAKKLQKRFDEIRETLKKMGVGDSKPAKRRKRVKTIREKTE